MDAGIRFSELLAWIGNETAVYERWFATRPEAAWTVPVCTGRTATVRELLFHVYAVGLRYGQRLHQVTVSSFGNLAAADAPELFALAWRGQELLRTALDGSVDLQRMCEFQTVSAGTQRASGRKILAHTLTHHLRHLAQVATALHQHGHATDWMHDLLLSSALD